MKGDKKIIDVLNKVQGRPSIIGRLTSSHNKPAAAAVETPAAAGPVSTSDAAGTTAVL